MALFGKKKTTRQLVAEERQTEARLKVAKLRRRVAGEKKELFGLEHPHITGAGHRVGSALTGVGKAVYKGARRRSVRIRSRAGRRVSYYASPKRILRRRRRVIRYAPARRRRRRPREDSGFGELQF